MFVFKDSQVALKAYRYASSIFFFLCLSVCNSLCAEELGGGSEDVQAENITLESTSLAESFFQQGESYLNNSSGKRSYALAMNLFTKAAELDHVKAKEKLLWLYTYLPNESTLKKRYRRELQAAKENNKEAQYLVAEMCEYGLGVELNQERAIFWYKKAAENNQPRAQNRLGELYAEGVIKEDSAGNEHQAFLWIQSAAENNQAQAQYKLAEYYLSGIKNVVQLNKESAFYWFQRSAKNGHILGQMQTAQMYRLGEGVKQNYEQALFWYEQALAQDYEPAHEQVRAVNTILDDIFLKNFK